MSEEVNRLRSAIAELQSIAASLEGTAPAPAPEPEPAPAPIPEPPAPAPAPAADVLPVILTDTGQGGPTRAHWSSHLFQRWVNADGIGGDWIDSDGVPQGNTPFAAAVVSGSGEVRLDVTRIVQSGAPVFLRSSGKNSPKATFGGRLSATPPRIEAVDADDQPIAVDVLAFACWYSSNSSPSDSMQACTIGSISNGAVSYRVGPGVERAELVLTCTDVHNVPTIAAYACSVLPPRIGGGGLTPERGLSAEVGSEAALAQHPDVYLAADFSDISKFVGWGETVPGEFIAEDDGRVTYRGAFMPGQNGSMSFGLQLSTCDLTDPLRPIKSAPTELYTRLYVFLEDDWLDVYQDGQKLGIGFDQRFGYWTSRGYWQRTTGNGGQRGTGLKIQRPPRYFSGMPDARWEYQGHMQRMEVGRGLADPTHPYRAYRPIQTYAYHLDQPGPNGQIFNFSRACLPIGRRVCIEQYIRANSIEGPFDAVGNGQAVPDGVLRTWIDGVPAGEVNGLRWRRHPDMGIEGPSIVWYYGGKTFPPHPMRYRMSDIAVARRLIGPRINFP